jgi:ligand-binding sensor domain-containing protein
MARYYPHKLIYSLILALAFSTSGNGQSQSQSGNKLTGQPRLVKTQAAGEGANVHCSLQDKSGNLWFGTTGEGVYKYDGKFFSQFTAKDGLNSNTVWCILEDKKGKMWLGTDAGLCAYNGGSFSKIQIPLSNRGSLYPNTLPNTVPSNKYDVWNIMEDNTGKLWFATTGGVYRYDGKTFTSFSPNEQESEFDNKKVEYILEDKAGNFWFGGRGNKGVFRYDGKSLTRIKLNGDNWAWPVLQDKNGNIWFSNWGGVFRYDGECVSGFTRSDGLCNENITTIIEDRKGNLWLGSDSENGGLCRYDGKTFAHFTTKEGLINNSIWTILEDKAGNLWIGSRNIGLCLYNGKTFTQLSR